MRELFKRKRNLAILIVMILMPLSASVAAAQGTENDQTTGTNGTGLENKALASALAFGMGAIGAGIAIYGATTAGAAAMAERPEVATWVLIFAALGEGLAIYGLVIAILILGA